MKIKLEKDNQDRYEAEIKITSSLNGKPSYMKFTGKGDSKREALKMILDSMRFAENRLEDAKEEVMNNW